MMCHQPCIYTCSEIKKKKKTHKSVISAGLNNVIGKCFLELLNCHAQTCPTEGCSTYYIQLSVHLSTITGYLTLYKHFEIFKAKVHN